MTRWTVHGTRVLHDSDTVRLELADLELTDGTRASHYVVRIPFDVASVVVHDPRRGVLMLHRHRFIVDRWLWDVPAGKVADGEPVADAAARASVDETGWLPYGMRVLGAYHPSPGISDQRFHVCVADGAEQVGEPNPVELDRLDWLRVESVRELIREGAVDGLSLTALLWALEAGPLPRRAARSAR